MKKINIVDSRWHKIKGDMYLGCCDCGLVHRMSFKVEVLKGIPKAIYFRMWRNEKLTKKLRKDKKII